MRPRVVLAAVVALVLSSSVARADDAAPAPVVLQTPAPRALCKALPTSENVPECRLVPPGRFLDEATWQRLDARFRELEEARTRLTAENKSLRGAVSAWQPGWGTLLLTLAGGVTLGWAAHRYVFDR